MKSFKFGFARPTLASLALLTLLGTSASATPLNWKVLRLINDWEYSAGSRKPTAALDADGIVHLRGALQTGALDEKQVAFYLPAAMRPNKIVALPVTTYFGGIGRLNVQPDGRVFVVAAGSDSAKLYTSLEGVTFSKF